MTWQGWMQILIYVAVLTALTPPLGGYMAQVYMGNRVVLERVLGGGLVVRRGDSSGLVVERPDGSHRRCLPDLGIYAVASWSPDGRKLLVMRDVSGWHFTMFAVSVDAPFEIVSVAEHVRVPNSHTWPGRGDVSWQPRPTK